MKKFIIGLLAVSSVLAMSLIATPVEAVDFAAEEDKYIKLCSSSITSGNQRVCSEFNNYLVKKNKDLKKELSNAKKELNNTTATIDSVSSKISALSSQISSKQKEINYLIGSIDRIKNNIEKKEQEMKDRLYVMQTSYNSNTYVEFIFGASSFSDFFSRLMAINDITAYEKELVDELASQKSSLDSQKTTLLDAKASLVAQEQQQKSYQDKLISMKASQQSDIKNTQTEVNEVNAAQKKIDAALDQLISNAPTGGGGSYVAGSSAAGNAVAQKALTKLGSRYWWGAPGGGYGDGQGLDNPNAKYFDCSGFVAWSHIQVGISIGRRTAAGYSGSGKGLSRDQLQAGDVITFSYGSGVAHIGIYIGGGSFVHASGKGSGTRGQYADQCVKVSPLAGYWSKYVYNYRRLY